VRLETERQKAIKAATNLPQFIASTCRLLSLGAQLVFNELFAILGSGTPYPLLNQGFYGSLKSRR